MLKIAFPGLGIEPFAVNRVAFSLFGRDVAWYGVIICAGMLLAFFYGCHTIKKEKISSDDFLNILLFIIPFGILGARLMHVAVNLDYYATKPFLEVIAIWNGGGAIYGSIIAGILVIVVYSRVRHLKILSVLDAFAPCVLIGQCLGRWGNFVNGEAFGTETALPWGMFLSSTGKIHHPTFLYESLWTLSMLLVIHFFLYRKKKYDGEILFFYLGFYGLGRAIVEAFRADYSFPVFGMRFSMLVALAAFLLFGTLFVLGFARAKQQPEKTAETEEPAPTDTPQNESPKNTTDESETDHDLT
ncbi:MAG: prolipoprotein diacylglyceryl transferase [Clostridia bacterium]|nr:prolipoprotein diacylglyceryl transferase [Clostridia bacterium]